jgi:hypothetical protein
MNTRQRIERLEARSEKTYSGPEERGYWAVMLYYNEVENHQREQEGLPPIPYTKEELGWQRELDEEFLQDGLPRMRASPGWQSSEAQARLAEWEHDIREKYLEERNS